MQDSTELVWVSMGLEHCPGKLSRSSSALPTDHQWLKAARWAFAVAEIHLDFCCLIILCLHAVFLSRVLGGMWALFLKAFMISEFLAP